MLKTPAALAAHSNGANVEQPHATPLAGVMFGSMISLLLWAVLLAIVFAIS